jgi:acetyl esterase
LLVISGTADPLIDGNRAFAEKLKATGMKAEHFIAEAMPHDFYFFPGVLDASEGAFAAVSNFLARPGKP